jgi:hypothetical protein
MLTAQRREFDEKKKDESPYPRELARWLALDYFRRPRGLKARRFHVTLATTLAFTLLSVASFVPGMHRLHQACPVSKSHAMFANDCAKCHDQAFQPVRRLLGCPECVSASDQACSSCHRSAPHHGNEPACASCHREHRGHEILAAKVADNNCVACHSDMEPAITHFNRDHPEFRASLPNQKDPSNIRFNHKAHLDLDLGSLRRALEKAGRHELKGLGDKVQCADCHQLDDERKYVRPISYENHCARCHALTAPLIGDFAAELKPAAATLAKVPLPHKEPAVVRAVLRDRLVDFAQQHRIAPGKGAPGVPRPLPWKPVTEEQWSWASEQAKKTEGVLFMNKQWSKVEPFAGCSHCHIERERVGGLPVYLKTEIPARWHPHSVFSHGSHRSMACADCHDRNAAKIKVADSQSAADILMPTLQTCQECHIGQGGARNTCALCHRYHSR